MSEENQVIQNDTNNANNVVENVVSDSKIESEVSNESEVVKDAPPEENKISNEEAAKIRQSTEHKLSKKFEKEIAERNAQIAALQQKINEASTPPDNDSVYDQLIGGWRRKNINADEYKQLLIEAHEKQQQSKQQEEFLAPVKQRISAASQKIADFQSTLGMAGQQGLITDKMALIAGQTEGGLEVLYDLVKANSPKVIELQRLPEYRQAEELWRLAWLKNNPPKSSATNADKAISPVDEKGDRKSVHTDYDNLNFHDAFEEFKKRRR